MPYQYSLILLFRNVKWFKITSGLSHIYTQAKGKGVCLTEWFLLLKKYISFSLKNAIVKVSIIIAITSALVSSG